MSGLQPVRGTKDLLPEDCRRYNYIVEKARQISLRYGFHEVSTPIFEFLEVFKRTLGDASDIVNKEMYAFSDRGGEELVLRPEGTASIARAFISGGLAQNLPIKFFYQGPMFRYERPQKGRSRQFHQCGVELLGADTNFADVEVISLAHVFLNEIGVRDKVRLEINSIGDDESRQKYRSLLVEYFTKFESQLSQDSQKRLKTNPLRILDTKDENDKKLLQEAPRFSDSLNSSSRMRIEKICSDLERISIPYQLNPQLVRGLDYYCHCVFEFKTDDLGAQDTVLSGGRYNHLIKTMGGPDTPGVGWASGIDRLMLLLDRPLSPPRPIAIVPLGDKAEARVVEISHTLRSSGLPVEVAYSGNLSKRMKKAHKVNAKLAIILGDEEIASGEATVKDLDSGNQRKIKITQLASQI